MSQVSLFLCRWNALWVRGTPRPESPCGIIYIFLIWMVNYNLQPVHTGHLIPGLFVSSRFVTCNEAHRSPPHRPPTLHRGEGRGRRGGKEGGRRCGGAGPGLVGSLCLSVSSVPPDQLAPQWHHLPSNPCLSFLRIHSPPRHKPTPRPHPTTLATTAATVSSGISLPPSCLQLCPLTSVWLCTKCCQSKQKLKQRKQHISWWSAAINRAIKKRRQ